MKEKATRYILSPYIYVAVFPDEGMGILLDMQHEYYEKITAYPDWLLFFQTPQSLEDLNRYNTDRSDDILAPFVQYCIKHNYIREVSSELPSPSTVRVGKRSILLRLLRIFSLPFAHHIEGYLLIDVIDHLLASQMCYSLIQNLAQCPTSQSVPEHILQKFCQGVQTSAIIHKSEALCLHQSLALFWMLRSRGYHADVQIRIQLDPFLAHMIVREGNERVLWWQAGNVPQQYYEQFLSSTTPIFSSDSLQMQIFLGGGEV